MRKLLDISSEWEQECSAIPFSGEDGEPNPFTEKGKELSRELLEKLEWLKWYDGDCYVGPSPDEMMSDEDGKRIDPDGNNWDVIVQFAQWYLDEDDRIRFEWGAH